MWARPSDGWPIPRPDAVPLPAGGTENESIGVVVALVGIVSARILDINSRPPVRSDSRLPNKPSPGMIDNHGNGFYLGVILLKFRHVSFPACPQSVRSANTPTTRRMSNPSANFLSANAPWRIDVARIVSGSK